MELRDLKGLGQARLEVLRAMGLSPLRDLLCMLPARYIDATQPVPCALAEGEAAVAGRLRAAPKVSHFRGLTKATAALEDDSGALPLVWYNQPWVAKQRQAGEALLLYGRVVRRDGRRELANPQLLPGPGIYPVYRGVPGLPAKTLQQAIAQALTQAEDCLPETLPQSLRLRCGLCEKNFAIRQAHQPTCMENLRMAQRRLAFEEALLYQAALGLKRAGEARGFPLPIPDGLAERFWQALPFAPTGAQARVLDEIYADMRRDRPMSRLIQGDVGCGKTALAFGALWAAVQCGAQGALMAPTEILARQHYESAQRLLAPLGVRCGLLTGALTGAKRRAALEQLASGGWQVVVGTHALLSEGVRYARLGLVVTDEQHRFGVKQRSALERKGERDGAAPHTLVMSATPIPRTLALILYGDLDISVVDELPPGRTPVKTRIVPEEKRAALYDFLRRETAAGRQAYIVCPLVEESEALGEVKAATAQYAALAAGPLRGLRVGLTYGRQGAEEKARVLADFAAGALDVLVATTVIEVGVNVPNATVMVIENAERYGLSQLHQLRGRVGRGAAESWCFLLAQPSQRLRTLTQTADGFAIAQKDLELRGPGELLGTRQHGLPMASLGDARLLEEAVRCMRELRENPAYAAERAQVEAQAAARFRQRLDEVTMN